MSWINALKTRLFYVINTFLFPQKIDFSRLGLYLFAVFFSCNFSFSQTTTLIDPAAGGGFELGTTPLSNGWSSTHGGGTNTETQWVVNTAVPYAGSNSAYVSNSAGAPTPSNKYKKDTENVTHLYQNFTIPTTATNATLLFYWKGEGQSNKDYLRVYFEPASNLAPNYGAHKSCSGIAPTGIVDAESGNTSTTFYQGSAIYQLVSINIPAVYFTNSAYRLTFEWINDAVGGNQSPASIDNVSLTYDEPCSGIPIAGATVLSPSSGAQNSTISGYVTGSTTGSNLSYQWEFSEDGITSWTAILGQTSETLSTVAIPAVGTRHYRRSISCTGLTTYSTPAMYTTELIYCTPAGASNNADEIRNFTLNDLNNSSAASEGTNGYMDYSRLVAPANLHVGQSYTPALSTGNGSLSHGAAIWIDYNDNGIFEASERVTAISNSISPNTTANFPSFVVSNSPGSHRLRVQYRLSVNGTDLDPCTASTYSETEDYEVLIVVPCIATVISSSATAICESGTSDISVTANAFTTIIELYSNPSGGTSLATITGNSGTLTSPNIISSSTFYIEVSDGNCQSIRSPIEVIVNPIPTLVTASYSASSICTGGSVDLSSSAESNYTSTLILLSPTGAGGFESGATFADNGWTMAATGNNLWYVGNAVVNSGSNAAYISTNGSGGVAAKYNTTKASIQHIYTDVFIPVGVTDIQLSFNWLGVGEVIPPYYYDFLRVSMVDPTTTPVAGTNLLTGILAANLNNQPSWQYLSIPINNSVAGTTQRFVFTWENDGSGGTSPGGVIDNVSVTAKILQPANFAWTSSPVGFTSSSQNPSGVAPTVTTTYTVEATNASGCRQTSSVVVSVKNPTATITSTNTQICHGNTETLTGTVTIPNSVVNIDNGVGAVTALGTNWSVTVNPTTTTTYAITSVTSGGCTGTGTGSATFTLPTKSGNLANDGESATCPVSGTNWVHFYHPTNGNLIGSVNANGDNLGNVTLQTGTNSGGAMFACNTGNAPQYETAYMGRNWQVSSTAYPASATFGSQAILRLPYANTELSAMNVIASVTTIANPNDNDATLSDIMLTKISGGSQDGNPSNDCAASILGIEQDASGSISVASSGVVIASGDYAEFKVSQFSEMFLHKNFNNSPLPVTLTNFSATCDNEVTLSWTTASEQNSDRFIVEKSRDGNTWSIGGEQAAAGNSNTTLNYNFTDPNSWNATSYYRLRQIDFNGAEEVYGPISVSCKNKESSLTVYPNPNSGSFIVEIASTEMYTDAQLFLTDLTGKVITSQKVNIASGTTQILINDLDLKMGTYLVTLRGADQQLKTVKVMVTR